jgi:mannosyl-oligosaccharide alpha-1,2-mannosidase
VLFVSGIVFGVVVLDAQHGVGENSALSGLVQTSTRLRERIKQEEQAIRGVVNPNSAGAFEGARRGAQQGLRGGEDVPVAKPARGKAPAAANTPDKQLPTPIPTSSDKIDSPDSIHTFEGGASDAIKLLPAGDSASLSFSTWLYLPAAGYKDTPTIKTIASTRASGCFDDKQHDGFSFYVNEWETSNRQLRLEWTSTNPAGCVVLASETNALPLDKWVHVAFAFEEAAADGSAPERAMIFIDGKLVKQTDAKGRHLQTAPKAPLMIGVMTDGQYAMQGRMAYAVVTHSAITPAQLAHAMRQASKESFAKLASMAAKQLTAALVLSDKAPYVIDLTKQLKPVASNHADKGNTSPLSVSKPSRSAASGDYVPEKLQNLDIPTSGFDFTKGGNQWVSRFLQTEQSRVAGPITDKAALASGAFDDAVSPEEMAASDANAAPRAAEVVEAMRFVWKGYKEKAWGADELRPRSGGRVDNWGGLGMTLLDSLDTMWLMGMKEEFDDALLWVKEHLNFDRPRSVSVFETTIRALGGLLSAYDMSGEPVLLEKAVDLANRLMPAFNTPTGIPNGQVNLRSGAAASLGWTGSSSILAELGTLQVEFRYLSHASGEPKYARAVERVIEHMSQSKPEDGLFPIYISPQTGKGASRQISFGAMGDSFYEYLVKVWLQGGRTESMYREMYDNAINGMTRKMLLRTTPSQMEYVAEWHGNGPVHKMDHLACFVPGMLALGAYTAKDGVGSGTENVQRDLQNAKALAYTCWQMYEQQKTGLAPEYVDFRPGQDMVVPARAPWNLLRPEAAESLFILHQLTGNPIYREWGWKMFTALRQYTKTKYGFGQHPDVRDTSRKPDDKMESFFLAETLKYLYLLQSPDHPIKLTDFVFNTEAHPMRAFKASGLGDATREK